MGSVPYGDTGPWVKDLCVTGTNADTVTFGSQQQYGEGLEFGVGVRTQEQMVDLMRRAETKRWPKGECWLPDMAPPKDIDRLILEAAAEERPIPRPPPAPANELVAGVPVWNYRIDDIHLGWYALGLLALVVLDWLSPAWRWL